MRNNIIANCSDVGIDVNKSANTKILHNTLIGTNGVDFRFETTTGEAQGNVLTSKIRIRDGGAFQRHRQPDEREPRATWAPAGTPAPLAGEPARSRADVSSLIGGAAARSAVTDDHCARPRPSSGAYTLGALEHSLGDCGTGTGTPTDGGTPADAGHGN